MGDKANRPAWIEIPEPSLQSAVNATNVSNDEPISPKSAANTSKQANTQTGAALSPVPETPSTSWSVRSDKQLGHGSADRVFPVRSVVSVDPLQTPLREARSSSGEERNGYPGLGGTFAAGNTDPAGSNARHNARMPSTGSDNGSFKSKGSRKSTKSAEGRVFGTTSKDINQTASKSREDAAEARTKRAFSGGTQRRSDDDNAYVAGNRAQLFRYAESENSQEKSDDNSAKGTNTTDDSSDFRTPVEAESIQGHVTARFKHVITKEGHAIVTGRDGETLQKCEDEPIHIPGAVQGFGLLVALSEETEGILTVRIVSENSKRIIGFSPQELFKLRSFTDILSEEQADNLLDHVDFIRDEEADPATNGPEVFILSIRDAKRKAAKLWCAMHINPSHPDLIICEFELDDDQLHPLAPANEELADSPEDTLHLQPTSEELAESTHIYSKPLRILRSARKRKGEAAAMEVFNIMSQVQEQLSSAPNLVEFLKILVGVVKELTGFHRVMIYQFDNAWNGRVVTELVDPRATKDLYKGLNFPASDIPKQARDLYKINRVRLLYDRDLETARLVCRTVEDLETPLDLSYSYLRAMSPIHIKYLANMAVRSSMSISINAFGELWGLISCHTYGLKGTRVSFPIRKMCRLIGDTASRNIERLSYASRLQARKLINTVPTEANPTGYIVASSDDLLTLFDADFGLLSIRGETKIMGHLEQSQEALAMLEYLRMRNINSVITSQDIKEDFPDLRYGPGFSVIAGLLLVPLALGGTDFIVFFRKGQVKEVKWAGNPYEKFVREGTEGYLEPRKSFKTWSEIVVGQCREWTEEQVETASVLCIVYGKFIEVWRQKEEAVQSSQLTRILLSNSAHEVRTPLNAIINYLEIALEGDLDQETRDNLAKSHSASKSLIYVINDLLDLTKIEHGLDLIKDEVFDLPETVREVTEAFEREAKKKGIEFALLEHPGIPKLVIGDQRRVRQAVLNITANAMQHTLTGSVHVELFLAEREGQNVAIDIIVEDTGIGMSDQKLDALFMNLEQVSTDWNGSFGDTEDGRETLVDSSQKKNLGLGLAVVARIVRNMDGQLRLKSELGHGSRFVIQLPFILPDAPTEGLDNVSQSSSRHSLLERVRSQPIPEGEMLLVDRASSHKSDGIVMPRTLDEAMSITSFRSASSGRSGRSTKSDVDRLIGSMSDPHMAVRKDTEQAIHHNRSNSKGSGGSKRSTTSVGHGTSKQSYHDDPQHHKPTRSKSQGWVSEHLRSLKESPLAGEVVVNDVKTPLKAIRIPPDGPNMTTAAAAQAHHHVEFDLPAHLDSRAELVEIESHPARPLHENSNNLQVLVAEDDPINSRIIKKRLEKAGHDVFHTINGEECAQAYSEKPTFFDVVLMDMQMPIVDGMTATKMIRSHEVINPSSILTERAALNGRVPIIAVSASLVEREHDAYVAAGFDGWILKPIDFKRLEVLLQGIVVEAIRNECLYVPGEWERGGWFDKRGGAASKANRPSISPLSPIDAADHNQELSRHGSESSSTDTLLPGSRSGSRTDSGSGKGSGTQNMVGRSTSRERKDRPLVFDERLDRIQPGAKDGEVQ